MNRWRDKRRWRTLQIIAALGIAWLLKYAQASPLMEIYYLAASPFTSNRQLLLEDRLTNARILELEHRLEELEQQNTQFKKLLGYQGSESKSGVIAPIIGRNVDSWWHQVILGKGSNEGIEEGYIVTGIGGVVGRVIGVTPNTSRILLISDPNSRIGAVVSRNRHVGYLQGKNSQTATMTFFAQVSDLQPGDAVTTSPISNLYPSGIPIGSIKSVRYDKGATPEAEVELTVPLELLEWVVVHPFKPKLTINSRQQGTGNREQ
ncbi:MAG: rod shape-determining protein MreC [Xenococcaceae cyanobacterium MO_207.B15]|nr:rod shape-determining protein MreC [Xenococcaceae cyanobacterium MO_207.B15]